MSPVSTSQSKIAFGQFVAAKRRFAGLTQRELAERLFVTESAVSKWERGLSYPDISVVIGLAEALGVSEGELITASDDDESPITEYQAQSYRRWRSAVLRGTGAVYALGLLATFIVNLTVQHTLSWFWVVLAAVATAFSLTTLPLLVPKWRGWLTLGGFLVSLITLLAVIRLLYGGEFFTVAVSSVLFAALVVFLPFALRDIALPEPLRSHRTVLALAAITVALPLFVYVVLVRIGAEDSFVDLALPIVGIVLAFAWLVALLIRYLPGNDFYTAAAVTALSGVFGWAIGPIIDGFVTGRPLDFGEVDLTRWAEPYIDGNVTLIVLVASIIAAMILTALGITVTVRRWGASER